MSLLDFIVIKTIKLFAKFQFQKNFIEIDDFFNGDHIENYSLLENNLNVSTSFEIFDNKKTIDMRYFSSS